MVIPSMNVATCFVVNAFAPSADASLGDNPGLGIALVMELCGGERAKVAIPPLLLWAYRLRDPSKLATCLQGTTRNIENIRCWASHTTRSLCHKARFIWQINRIKSLKNQREIVPLLSHVRAVTNDEGQKLSDALYRALKLS